MKTVLYGILLMTLCSVCPANNNIIAVRVTLDEATKQIIKEGNKRVLGANTEIIDGREVHIIKVLTPDGHIKHYKIDAGTGEIQH